MIVGCVGRGVADALIGAGPSSPVSGGSSKRIVLPQRLA
jgi:hypothetical protein